VTIGAMTISHCTKPVCLYCASFNLLFSNQGPALSSDLRDKDWVLVHFRWASSTHVTSHRVETMLLYN